MKKLLINLNFPGIFIFILFITACFGPYLLPISFLGVNLFAFRLICILLFPYTLYQYLKKYKISFLSFSLKLFYFTLFFWTAYALIQLPLVTSLRNGVANVINLLLGILVFVTIFNQLNEYKTSWLYLRKAVIIFILINGIVVIYELITNNHLPSSYVDQMADYESFIPVSLGFAGNPNNNIYLMDLCIPLLFINNEGDKISNKGLISICILLILISAIFSASRLSFLVFIFNLLSIFWYRKNKRINWFKIILPFFLVLLVALYVRNLEFDFSDLLFSSDNISSESTTIRMQHIENTIYYLKETFGMGLGPGEYESLGNKQRGMPLVINPHNLFIEVFIDYGLFVGILFFSSLFIRIFGERKSSFNRNNYLLNLLGISFLLLSPQNSGYLSQQIFWVFLGIIFANNAVSGNPKDSLT